MRLLGFLIISFCFSLGKGQVPVLNTDTNSNYVIFLDFDSAYVTGTSWNSLVTGGNPINAGASRLSNAQITETWKRIAAEFEIFDLNITTDSTRFNSATATQRMRVIFTDSSNWYSPAGGVAFLNSFASSANNPAWVFEDNLGPYSPRFIADAAAHEIGHTLNLYHQSVYNGGCVKTDEYNPGNGTGTTIRWAPIMGVAYYSNITTWYNGTNSTACGTYQYDVATIMSSAGLSLLADDHGDTITLATNLPINGTSYSTSGIITDTTDVDYFKLVVPSTTTITLAATPVSPTSGVNFVNLDIELKLLDSIGGTLKSNDSASTPLAYIGPYSVAAGTYYISIDGVGSANYGDYGSLGKYTLDITSTVSLPHNRITLAISPQSDFNLLEWKSNISNIQGFNVEESKDAEVWDLIGEVNTEPFNLEVSKTTKYYRVKALDPRGKVYISNIVSSKRSSEFKIVPNPNNGQFSIEAPEVYRRIPFKIISSTGRLIYKGLNHSYSIPELQPGIYFVQMGDTIKKVMVN